MSSEQSSGAPEQLAAAVDAAAAAVRVASQPGAVDVAELNRQSDAFVAAVEAAHTSLLEQIARAESSNPRVYEPTAYDARERSQHAALRASAAAAELEQPRSSS